MILYYYCAMQVVVSYKGQVTIPAFLRKLFDIKPKDKVVFKATKEGIVISKSVLATEKLFGAAGKGKGKFVPLSKVRKQVGKQLGEKYQVRTLR